MRFSFLALSASLGLCLSTPALMAQDLDLDSGSAVETQQDQTTSDTTPEAEAAAEAANAAPTPQATQTTPQTTRPAPSGFVLRDIRFQNGSAYLAPQEIAAAKAALIGQRYGNGSAQALAEALTQMYRDRGIRSARVIPYNVSGGVLNVAFYEPVIGATRGGTRVVSDRYLDFRLQLPKGALADDRQIDPRIARLQATDGLPLSYDYVPSAENTVDVVVNVPDIQRHVTTVTLDNYGSPAFGREQLGVSHTINGLTGWNDPLTIATLLRRGSVTGTIDYSRVVLPNGGRVSLSLLGTNSRSFTGPLVTGRTRSATAGFSLPVIASAERGLSFFVSGTYNWERSSLLGIQTLNMWGPQGTAGVTGYLNGEGWSLSASGQITAGTYSDAVFATSGNTYVGLSGSALGAFSLGEHIFASVSVSGQYGVSGVMPTWNTFTVTGPAAVRGYPTNLSVGDSGYVARFQIEKSAPFALGAGIGVRPFVFGDVGQAFDSTGAPLGLASSVGVGTSFTQGNNVFGDIYVAKPLTTGIVGWGTPSGAPTIGGSISVTF
ncbi:MAG: ShlB/FhaC/HecB family hemolysin secretion/activation protein [Pseudomonadota bacterium]|nr:ShlB/FhaC/HecB family hemolysin secretion/activation protein [Pseudomonadota bacterium]